MASRAKKRKRQPLPAIATGPPDGAFATGGVPSDLPMELFDEDCLAIFDDSGGLFDDLMGGGVGGLLGRTPRGGQQGGTPGAARPGGRGNAGGLDDFYSIVDMVDTTSPVAQHHYQQQPQPQPSNAFRRQDARRRSPAGQAMAVQQTVQWTAAASVVCPVEQTNKPVGLAMPPQRRVSPLVAVPPPVLPVSQVDCGVGTLLQQREKQEEAAAEEDMEVVVVSCTPPPPAHSMELEIFSDGFRYCHAGDGVWCGGGLLPFSATTRNLLRKIDHLGILPLPMYEQLTQLCKPPLAWHDSGVLLSVVRDFRPMPAEAVDCSSTPCSAVHVYHLRLRVPGCVPAEAVEPMDEVEVVDTVPAPATQVLPALPPHGKKRGRGRPAKGKATPAAVAANRKPAQQEQQQQPTAAVPPFPLGEVDPAVPLAQEQKELCERYSSDSLSLHPEALLDVRPLQATFGLKAHHYRILAREGLAAAPMVAPVMTGRRLAGQHMATQTATHVVHGPSISWMHLNWFDEAAPGSLEGGAPAMPVAAVPYDTSMPQQPQQQQQVAPLVVEGGMAAKPPPEKKRKSAPAISRQNSGSSMPAQQPQQQQQQPPPQPPPPPPVTGPPHQPQTAQQPPRPQQYEIPQQCVDLAAAPTAQLQQLQQQQTQQGPQQLDAQQAQQQQQLMMRALAGMLQQGMQPPPPQPQLQLYQLQQMMLQQQQQQPVPLKVEDHQHHPQQQQQQQAQAVKPKAPKKPKQSKAKAAKQPAAPSPAQQQHLSAVTAVPGGGAAPAARHAGQVPASKSEAKPALVPSEATVPAWATSGPAPPSAAGTKTGADPRATQGKVLGGGGPTAMVVVKTSGEEGRAVSAKEAMIRAHRQMREHSQASYNQLRELCAKQQQQRQQQPGTSQLKGANMLEGAVLQPAMRPDQILDMLLGQRSQPEPSSTRAAKSSTPSTPPQQSPPPKQEEAQDASLVLPDAVLALQQPRSHEPRVPRQAAGSGISTVAAESDVMAVPVAREGQQQAVPAGIHSPAVSPLDTLAAPRAGAEPAHQQQQQQQPPQHSPVKIPPALQQALNARQRELGAQPQHGWPGQGGGSSTTDGQASGKAVTTATYGDGLSERQVEMTTSSSTSPPPPYSPQGPRAPTPSSASSAPLPVWSRQATCGSGLPASLLSSVLLAASSSSSSSPPRSSLSTSTVSTAAPLYGPTTPLSRDASSSPLHVAAQYHHHHHHHHGAKQHASPTSPRAPSIRP